MAFILFHVDRWGRKEVYTAQNRKEYEQMKIDLLELSQTGRIGDVYTMDTDGETIKLCYFND